MKQQKPSLPLKHTHGGTPLAPYVLEAGAQEVALNQHQEERRARLFRHVGDKEDDLYLRDLMTRYRGAPSS